MRAHIITIGNELLSGRTVNSNAAYIGHALAAVGAPVAEITVVGDDDEAIVNALQRAVELSDVIVTCGGLGPTHDDITKVAMARALSLELVFDPEAMKRIEARYERWARKMPEAAQSMAMIPKGATTLPNEWGTAPGLHIEYQGTHIFVVPGVPREMRGLISESVVPALRKLPGLTPVYTRALATSGVPESTLAERLSDLIPPEDGPIAMAFLPGYGGVELRFTTTTAEAELDELVAKIEARLGKIVVGDADAVDLVSAVGDLLRERGETLATAESCTGGWLGKVLTDRAGSSDYYVGGVVAYSNEIKVRLLGVAEEILAAHGAVSAETAAAMASGARERLGADYALAITGIAGPGGGTDDKPVGLIYLGMAHGGGVETRRLRLSNDREQNRERSVYAALNLLRRHLEGGDDS